MILKSAYGLKQYLNEFPDEELKYVDIFTTYSDNVPRGRFAVEEDYGSEPSNKGVLIAIQIISSDAP